MFVFNPVTITDAMLVSSTAAEPRATPQEVEYNAGTTYDAGNEVISTSTHRTYESLQAGNIGHALPVLPETTTTWWLDIGPTNRWAMFDLYRNTQTIIPNSAITVVLTPGEINSLALDGLEATSVVVTMQTAGSPTETLYSHTENLSATQTKMALFDLPTDATAILTVTINNTGGSRKCGSFAVGTYVDVGETQMEAESDELNFSTITRETTGEAVLVSRGSVPRSKQRILCEATSIAAVLNLRTDLGTATPAVWSGMDDDSTHAFFHPLLIFGIARAFRISLADPTCTIDLELEGI